jgi:hypothetical protein
MLKAQRNAAKTQSTQIETQPIGSKGYTNVCVFCGLIFIHGKTQPLEVQY